MLTCVMCGRLVRFTKDNTRAATPKATAPPANIPFEMFESAARLSLAIVGERGDEGDAGDEVDAETSWLRMGGDVGVDSLVDILLP